MNKLFLALAFLAASSAHAAEVTDIDLNLSYGSLSQYLAPAVESALQKVVRRENCEAVKANEYRCGELAVGKIKNSEEKILMDFAISDMSGKEDGVKYELRGESVDIFLSRRQFAADWNMASLDSRKAALLPTSAKFGNDLLVGLKPKNGSLDSYVCVNIPGLRGHSENVVMKGKMRKSISWFPDIKAKLTVKVDVGSVRFDNAKICSQVRTTMDAKGLPKLELVSISDPKFYGLSHEGLKVKVDADVSGLWGFINGITKIFGFNIEKVIAQRVQQVAQKKAAKQVNVTLKDVRDGRWISKYLDAAHFNRDLEKISHQLRAQLLKNGWGKGPVENALRDMCLAQGKAEGLTGAQLLKLAKTCQLLPKIQPKFFVAHSGYAKAGCYSHYFDPRKANGKWWSEGCKVVNTVRVETPDGMGEPLACIAKFWNEGAASARCQSVVRNFLAEVVAGRWPL